MKARALLATLVLMCSGVAAATELDKAELAQARELLGLGRAQFDPWVRSRVEELKAAPRLSQQQRDCIGDRLAAALNTNVDAMVAQAFVHRSDLDAWKRFSRTKAGPPTLQYLAAKGRAAYAGSPEPDGKALDRSMSESDKAVAMKFLGAEGGRVMARFGSVDIKDAVGPARDEILRQCLETQP